MDPIDRLMLWAIPGMLANAAWLVRRSREEHLNLGEALTSTAISAGLGWAAVLALAMVWSQDRSTRRSD